MVCFCTRWGRAARVWHQVNCKFNQVLLLTWNTMCSGAADVSFSWCYFRWDFISLASDLRRETAQDVALVNVSPALLTQLWNGREDRPGKTFCGRVLCESSLSQLTRSYKTRETPIRDSQFLNIRLHRRLVSAPLIDMGVAYSVGE